MGNFAFKEVSKGVFTLDEPSDELYLPLNSKGIIDDKFGADEVWRAIRKLSNKNILKVVSALERGPLTFPELMKETGLTISLLNHILYDMKNSNLIIKSDRKYALTKFSHILLATLLKLKESLQDISSKEELFSP